MKNKIANKTNDLFNKTRTALLEKIKAADWGEITIQMKKSGHELYIKPMSQMCHKIEDLSDIEYYLVDGSPILHMGSDSLDRLVNDLINYDQLLIELDDSKTKLKNFFDEYVVTEAKDPNYKTYESENFGTYSDWHKDVFGYRPRGIVFGERLAA